MRKANWRLLAFFFGCKLRSTTESLPIPARRNACIVYGVEQKAGDGTRQNMAVPD